MAQCIQVRNGQLVLDASPASSCSGYLLLSAGIAGVWATAWVFRQVAGFLWASARSNEEVL